MRGVVLNISVDGGRTWCSIGNGGTLNKRSGCFFPAETFKYRFEFIANTKLDNVKFDFDFIEPEINWVFIPMGINVEDGNYFGPSRPFRFNRPVVFYRRTGRRCGVFSK